MSALVEQVVTAVVLGLVGGTVYGLIAVGFALIFKAQRVVNVAQAELAAVGAYVLYALRVRLDLPYAVAALLAVSATVVLAIAVERLVIRPLRDRSDVTVLMATAGVALLVVAVTSVAAGTDGVVVPAVFPGLEQSFAESGWFVALLTPQRLMVLGVLVGSALALALLFSSSLGMGIRAMSASPFAARLAGIPIGRMSVLVWGIAGLLAGLAGVVFAPTWTLTPGLYTGLALLPALAAAVIGGLTSLPGALAAGLAIGILGQLVTAFAPADLPGPVVLTSFVVMLLVLLIRPRGLLVRGT